MYLTPLAWITVAGCQGLATSSMLLLEPPALVETSDNDNSQESASSTRPGNLTPTPSRQAQPTDKSTQHDPAPSAAPGLSRSKSMAMARTLLLQATARLEHNDLTGAAVILQRYVQAFPDAAMIRLQLGELCFKLDRTEESQHQFLAALDNVLDPALPLHCRLHAHSRLVDIASLQKDEFNEHLHRGIGLALLAERRMQESTSTAGATVQELQGKSRTALMKAKRLAPLDARPSLYLAGLWQSMQLIGNARSELQQAQLLSHLGSLSAYEELHLAQLAIELQIQKHISLNH